MGHHTVHTLHTAYFLVSVSVVMAVGNLGYSTVIVPGMFLEKFGAVWTAVLGLILGSASNFGVAVGIKFPTWFIQNFWAIVVLTLILGE